MFWCLFELGIFGFLVVVLLFDWLLYSELPEDANLRWFGGILRMLKC